MTLPLITPPPGLYEATLARVAAARRRAARVQLTVLGALSCMLTLLTIEALQFALSESGASGFGSFVSLLFSDGAAIVSRDFLLSLIESLPALAALMVVLLGGALLWSVARAARAARSAFAYV